MSKNFMHTLTPPIILENASRAQASGRFLGVVLFVDTSGFTPLTIKLSEQGRDGAEVLADILLAVFEPLVEAVYEHGGFIAGFAGDAFKAVFIAPEDSPTGALNESVYLNALAAAAKVQRHMAAYPSHETRYGKFDFIVRVSVASGPVTWSIWTSEQEDADQSSGYTFSGKAIEEAIQGEDHAGAGELVVTQSVYGQLGRIQPDLVEGKELTGAAAGYVAITRVRHSLSASTPSTNDGPLAADTASQIASRFYPSSLLNNPTRGEFRPVYSLFINTARLPAPGSDDDFLPFLFQLLEQYGGYLCRIGQIGASDPGGTFLLFWGAPSSHENDLDRVLNFLLAFQDGLDVPMRAGLTHSVVFAGFVGSQQREEYTCHGSSVNQAARQMTKAGWHQILLDAETADRAQERYITSLVGSFPLKGLNKPQQLFTLIGRQARSGPRYHQSDFVGRFHDLEALQEAIQPIFSGQFAGITLIEGEAGIGKSRLVHEFLMMTDATQDVQIFVGQVDEILREAFNPFRYFLQRYFEQSPTADDRRNRAWFEATLETLLAAVDDPDLAAELERTQSFLGALINLYWPDSLYEQVEPQLRRENTLAALKTLLQAEACRKPLILLVEDGQWLDPESIAFLELLARSIGDYPLTILVTARPTVDPTEKLFANEAIQQKIKIEALSVAEIAEIAQDYLGKPASQALIDLLVVRADGNPFFAEQMLLYLQEQGLLISVEDGQEGVWQLTEAALAKESAVPTDLQAVLVARLDRLTHEVKHVVQTAAVLGREFSVQVLSQMLRSDSMLDSKMLSAQESAVWNSVSELNYLFRHGLLRDAAYDMQLRAQLQELHHVAADSIEQLYINSSLAPWYEDLAYHYQRAGLPQKEREYAKLAGRLTAAAYNNDAAIAYFSRAFALTPPDDYNSRFDLLLECEPLYDNIGSREPQLKVLEQAEEYAKLQNDPEQLATVALKLSSYYEQVSNYPYAIEQANRSLQLAAECDHLELILESELRLAQGIRAQGHYEPACQQLQALLTKVRINQYTKLECQCLIDLAIAFWFLGDLEQMALFSEQALTTAYREEDLGAEISALTNLGIAASETSRYSLSREYYNKALERCRHIGNRYSTSNILNNFGYLESMTANYSRAFSYYEQALELYQELENQQGMGLALNNLGIDHLRCGNFAQASTYLNQALTLTIDIGDRRTEILARQNRGLFYLRAGQPEQAITTWKVALDISREVGHRSGECELLSLVAIYYLLTEDMTMAEKLSRDSLEIENELGDERAESDIRMPLGHALFGQQRFEEAEAEYQRAYESRQKLNMINADLDPLAGLAATASAMADKESAQRYANQLAARLTDGVPIGANEPFRVYLTCYRVLDAYQDHRANEVLDSAYKALHTWADNFAEPELRDSYLNNVPVNRAIIKNYLQKRTH